MTSSSLRRASPKTWCGSPWASKTWKISSGTWTRPSQPRRPHERRGRQHVAGAWHALRHHRPAAPAHSETIQAHRHSGALGESLPPQPFCRAVYEGGGLRDFSSQSARDGDPGPPLLCDAGRSASAARDRGYLPRVIRGAVHCGRSHRRRGQGRLDAAWRDPRAGRRARAGGGPRGVGYPDQARDYSKVEIRDGDLAGNVRRAANADWTFYVNRLGGPVDRSDWIMTPQTNDAYNGALRDIVFPAGILQPPVFDPNADPAINYGAVGGIIGHELTHGFDDQRSEE